MLYRSQRPGEIGPTITGQLVLDEHGLRLGSVTDVIYRTGSHDPEFLVVNLFHLGAFGVLAFAALKMRDRPDWHKRLMFGAIATVCAPGIARLLPLPFMVPWVFPILFAVVALFPIAGMVMDKRVHGRVHPAWWWALLVPVAAMGIGEVIAATGYAQNWVAGHVAGTPGADRPPEPFMPPGV